MLSRLRRSSKKRKNGQSLVELALTLPILLLLFLGLIELAFVLRAYLILVNANREAARFASRGTFTDEQIANQAVVSFAGQLPAATSGPDMNTGIAITRFSIPADPSEPGTIRMPVYYSGTVPSIRSTKLDVYAELAKLEADNKAFNDALVATHPDAVRGIHNVIFVETYYDHEEVLHAPIVEWLFPDPIVLYVRTMMRIAAAR